ncbi:MAG: 4Fe-4S binding protein [Deltaproteobacteria bacterium]|nr:4Fe-4S binding protein [Deltaproteobacteria bacterium]
MQQAMTAIKIKKWSMNWGIILLITLIPWFLTPGIALTQDAGFKTLEVSDTFKPLAASEFSKNSDNHEAHEPGIFEKLKLQLAALFFTILAGIMVRFKHFRFTRPLFLLGSLIILGFMNGGCPCVISSFQNLVLLGLGAEVKLYSVVWFLGIAVITYFLGRVWCGWVCHLGALQEFIYKSNRFNRLKSQRAQQIMRWMRYILAAALIIQLFFTQEKLFNHIDPFKVAFNLTSYYTAGWILLGILLITSLFIYRPFCRSACPVGLILGWISKIPGALLLAKNENCLECRRCSSACDIQAINEQAQVKNSDCLMCGTCLDRCKKQGLAFFRKGFPKAEQDQGLPEFGSVVHPISSPPADSSHSGLHL